MARDVSNDSLRDRGGVDMILEYIAVFIFGLVIGYLVGWTTRKVSE